MDLLGQIGYQLLKAKWETPNMPKIREITPTHLKCNNQHCMRVFADDTGQLVIVGKKLSEPQFSEFRDAIGEDEYAIKIPTEYLTNVFDKS